MFSRLSIRNRIWLLVLAPVIGFMAAGYAGWSGGQRVGIAVGALKSSETRAADAGDLVLALERMRRAERDFRINPDKRLAKVFDDNTAVATAVLGRIESSGADLAEAIKQAQGNFKQVFQHQSEVGLKGEDGLSAAVRDLGQTIESAIEGLPTMGAGDGGVGDARKAFKDLLEYLRDGERYAEWDKMTLLTNLNDKFGFALKEVITAPAEKKKISALVAEFLGKFNDLATASKALVESSAKLDQSIDQAAKITGAMASDARMKQGDAGDGLVGTMNSLQMTLAIAIGMAIVSCVFLAIIIGRSISSPISQLTAVMTGLAAGDKTVEVPSGHTNEIGQMATAVQAFKDAAIDKERVELEAAEQRGQAEADRRRGDDERRSNEQHRARATKEQEGVVQALAAGLDHLSQGDLTYRIETAFADEYIKLKGDFNAAMTQLQRTMTVISTNTHGIRSGIGEISQASDDLAQRTEQQSSTLEETAVALEEITATVRSTAEGARQAHKAVSLAKSDAARSGVVVKDAVEAMAGIEKSSNEISQIIGVIDNISFQTNLLALNASVEAARAGDAGKGFAVVASEVRTLAQRSADAAREIKDLIQASSEQVGRGVDLVGQAGQALKQIAEQIVQIDGVVSDIAHSAEEQANGIHQVNDAINNMDQFMQQNAAMVEEATAATHNLSQEAGELASLVSRFRTGGEPAIGQSSAGVRNAARRAA